MDEQVDYAARAFAVPGSIVYGVGALAKAASVMAGLGSHALVVTSEMMVELGSAQKLLDVLAEHGVTYTVFDGVNAEPTDEVVEAGARFFRENECDFLVALGGGSPLDTMKAIAMCVAGGLSAMELSGGEYRGSVLPMVAIPTTAGTGSEATRFTIITDTRHDVKMLISGDALFPDLAVIDPVFTMTAPAGVTAMTGVDALCHAIESYASRKAQPLSQTFSLSAAKRIFENLVLCAREPGNVEARTQMSLAATEAGIAFNNASVTLVHGMSRPIGALFHVPHGLSNAMLLEECLAFAIEGAPDRFAEIARCCGFSSSCDSDAAAAELLTAIRELLRELSIPTLAEFGVDRAAFMAAIPKMVEDALESGSPANTLRVVTGEDMRRIYEQLW